MPLTKLRKHNPVKLLFLMSVMPKTERIIFMLTIPFPFCFSFSENGRRNAAESTPYLWLLPAADYGYKNNTPLECAITERYSIHERLLGNGTTIKYPAASNGISSLQRCRAESVLRTLWYLTLAAFANWPCKHGRLTHCSRE